MAENETMEDYIMRRFLTVFLSILLMCTTLLTVRIANAEEDNLDIEEIAETIQKNDPEEYKDNETDPGIQEDLAYDYSQDNEALPEKNPSYDDLNVSPTNGTAYAVLTAEGELIFFRSFETYSNNTNRTVKDIYDNAYAGIVYSGFETSSYSWDSPSPWRSKYESIKKAYVAPNQIIKPKSTAYWFAYCSNMTSFASEGFDTSSVTDMMGMFRQCYSLTSLSLSSFDTSNVTNMDYMFGLCDSLTSLDVSGFDTSNVTSMRGMFTGCESLTSLDLDNFNTANVTSMYEMFNECGSLTYLNVSSFDTSKVTEMGYMFALGMRDETGQLFSALTELDVSNFDTSNVTDMHLMFGWCTSLTALNLSNFDTSKVDYMWGMFTVCSSLSSLDLSNFDTSNVVSMDSLFYECSSLNSIKLGFGFTKWIDNAYLPSGTWVNKEKDLSKTETELYNNYPSNASAWSGTWVRDISTVGDAYAVLTSEKDLIFFRSFETYTNGVSTTAKDIYDNSYSGIVYTGFETNSYDDGSRVPWFSERTTIKKVYVAKKQIIKPISFSYWFARFEAMTSFDASGFDTSEVTDMYFMFFDCSSLSTVDLSSFDTSKVTRLSFMFYDCTSLTEIDLSNLNTSKVTTMGQMFYNCSSLTSVNINSFDLSSVESMGHMFYGCSSLKSLDLSNLDTSRVEFFDNMFNGCSSLEILDFSKFNTANATDMKDMFVGCDSLNTVVLGTGFIKWNDDAKLPEGDWVNKSLELTKTETELQEQYPSHASEWAGTWIKKVFISSISLNEHELILDISDEKTLIATILPEDATFKELVWSSSDPLVVSVDQNGNIKALSPGEATITVSTTDGSDLSDSCTAAVNEPIPESNYIRIYRESRLSESLKTADELKKTLGIERFSNIIIAKDSDFADALSGSYLAAQKRAPILLVGNSGYDEAYEYIFGSLEQNGTVYILGSSSAVPSSFEEGLDPSITVKRLAGSSRYMTNLEILKEAGMTESKDIIVVTGSDFADSLSAGAVGLPILMVDKALKNSQKKFLEANVKANNGHIYILGQEASVSADLEKLLKTYGKTTRIGGSSRWVTTRLVAEEFFDSSEYVTLAYGEGFQDGLIASPLAYALRSPLFLVSSTKTYQAKIYVNNTHPDKAYIVGSKDFISDEAARKILMIDESAVITER